MICGVGNGLWGLEWMDGGALNGEMQGNVCGLQINASNIQT